MADEAYASAGQADLPKQEKNRPGQFQAGQSGNPSGRPAGSRNKASLAVESLLEGQAAALTQALIARALTGNTEALRLALERICPARKDRPVTFDLPAIRTAADLADAQEAIAQQVADGTLTPGEGVKVAALIEARRKTIETLNLEARIAALEAAASGKQP